MRRSITVMMAAGVLALAGCGGGSSGGQAAQAPGSESGGQQAIRQDPCSLVSAAELGQVLGVPMGPGRPAKHGDDPQCEWKPADTSREEPLVSARLSPADPAQDDFTTSHLTPENGLFADRGAAGEGFLLAQKGNVYLDLDTYSWSDADHAMMLRLGQIVGPRLR